MAIRFAQSASRHRISPDRVRFVVEHCPCPLYPATGEQQDLVLFLGADANGVPLEVIGVELDGGNLLVIHAMRLRRGYRNDYVRVMRWQG